MNRNQDKTTQENESATHHRKRLHPYFSSNSREETIRRMRSFPERAAKFLEKFNADREKNAR
ncbi:MAG: hypothetical protein ACRD6X_06345 [Pyrinomonadaceae bacterium]